MSPPLHHSRVFDLAAWPYDLVTAQDTWRESCRRMAALVVPGPVRLGLDLGTGPGVSAIEAARVHVGARWIAADLSLPMLGRARARIAAARLEPPARRPWPVAADAFALPLRDGAVDAVTAHSLFYLLPSRAPALAEVRRVLRPGGTLVFLEPNPDVTALAIATFVVRNALSPRFAASMLAWRVASRAYGRVPAARSREEVEAAGFRAAETRETLGGLGYFVVARA